MKHETFGIDYKRDVYNYHKNLIENDKGMGGSISKRVRERFNLTGEQVNDIFHEMKAMDNKPTLN